MSIIFPHQTSIIFYLLVLFPLLAGAFWLLVEFYSIRIAYQTLSWLPISTGVLLSYTGAKANHWTELLFPLTLLSSSILLFIGVGLLLRAWKLRQSWAGLLFSLAVASLPVIFFIYQMYLIANDPEFDRASPPFG